MRFSVVAAALVAVLTGFGGTLALIVGAARNLGADGPEAASWTAALCFGIGVSSIVLSFRHRMPIVTAWSLAGAALITALPPGGSMAEAVGAFILSAVLMVLAGVVPALGALVARLPAPIGAAMLAGLILRFVLGLFQAAQLDPALVLPLLAVFLVARSVHAASAPLVVIAAGLPFAWVLGHAMPAPQFGITWPIWVTPAFHPASLIGFGVPMFLVTVATQQVPGAAVLKVAGYDPPLRSSLVVTGLATLAMAPFGGYSVNLASVTAAICAGPEAHPDLAQRWKTGPVYGALYLFLALFGAGIGAMVAELPHALVATVAGAALLAPMTNALAATVNVPSQRFAAVTAFCVTASGLTILSLGGAFWGLVAGVLVLAFEHATKRL